MCNRHSFEMFGCGNPKGSGGGFPLSSKQINCLGVKDDSRGQQLCNRDLGTTSGSNLCIKPSFYNASVRL